MNQDPMSRAERVRNALRAFLKWLAAGVVADLVGDDPPDQPVPLLRPEFPPGDRPHDRPGSDLRHLQLDLGSSTGGRRDGRN